MKNDNTLRSKRYSASLGLMMTGAARITLILLLLTACFFSWTVSLVPDSVEDINLIKGLLWVEERTRTTIDKNAKEPEPDEKHWLLENANSSKNSMTHERQKTKQRLLFKPTAWLHEKRVIEDKTKLKQYDPARVSEEDCFTPIKDRTPPQQKQTEKQIEKKEGAGKDNDQNPSKCYRVDSWMPRNLILRERVLTADADLNPELASGLQAEDGDTKADDLKKITHLNLQGRNFDYADFAGSSLPKADLRRASFKHVNLYYSRLEKANLQSSNLDDANLSYADLTGADLSSAGLTGADLSYAELIGADLSSAELTGADLSYADLTGADLSSAGLIGADLSYAELIGADLSSAELTGANLSSAGLIGADLSSAGLTGADLSSAYLTGANLSYANLSGSILNNIVYQGISDKKSIEVRLKTFRKQLAVAPHFQTEQGKQALEEKVTVLMKNLKSTAFVKKVTKVPCVSNNKVLTTSGTCIAWDKADGLQKDKIFEAWKNLACQDDIAKRRMAIRIVLRTESILNNKPEWPGLATKLNQALQDAVHCPGLAGLSDYMKRELRIGVGLEESWRHQIQLEQIKKTRGISSFPHPYMRRAPKDGN